MSKNSKRVGKVLRGLVSEKPTGRAGPLHVFMAVFLAGIMAMTVLPGDAKAEENNHVGQYWQVDSSGGICPLRE